MISTAARAQALDVIGIGATLTENQRAFDRVIAFVVTGIAFLTVSFPEGVMIRQCCKVLLRSNHLYSGF
jgi:hypothetical protein